MGKRGGGSGKPAGASCLPGPRHHRGELNEGSQGGPLIGVARSMRADRLSATRPRGIDPAAPRPQPLWTSNLAVAGGSTWGGMTRHPCGGHCGEIRKREHFEEKTWRERNKKGRRTVCIECNAEGDLHACNGCGRQRSHEQFEETKWRYRKGRRTVSIDCTK